MPRTFTDKSLNRRILNETYHRALELDRASMSDDGERKIEASLSSELEYERFFGVEVLVHDAEAVDLTRAGDGLPMLFAHRHDQPIGLVENVRLEDNRLVGTLSFARNAKALEVWQDVADGMIKNISIGYRIKKWEQESDSDIVRVTRWELLEASTVAVPADHTVGIGRSYEEHESPTPADPGEATRGAPMAETDDKTTVVEFKRAREQGLAEGSELGMKSERARIAAIHDAFNLPSVPRTGAFEALRAECVDLGFTLERTQAAILELMGDADSRAIAEHGSDADRGMTHRRGSRVELGEDQRDKTLEMGVRAMTVKTGLEKDPAVIADARRNGLPNLSMLDIAAQCLRASNIDTVGLGRDELLDRAFQIRAGGHTTSDFANILENTGNKAILVGWDEAPETWNIPGLARIGSLPDFKTGSRPGLGNLTDLQEVGEDGEIKQSTMTDLKESYALKEFAAKFRLTRRAMLNDDAGAFAMNGRKLGRAASRMVGDRFWSVITTNAVLDNDGVALFASGHSNLQSSGAAPSVSQLDLAYADVEAQTDPSGDGFVGGEPKFLIGPPALRGTIETLVTASFNPANAYNTENRYKNRLVPVIEPRLTANSSTAWYLLKDANMFDTIELGFLNGITAPYMRNEQEWDTRAIAWVVGIDCEGKALDYRNAYKDPGT